MLAFCKMNMFLLSSLSSILLIQRVVGSVVGGSVGKWSVVGGRLVFGSVVHGFNKTQVETCLG